ncbi:MAG: hypothetical protein KDK03_16075 [Rhodobacteraceae bacterium]|nr:hypothetical protein [Paracoccaceae bacterium]
MELLMNGLLMAATLFAGGYCWVLSRRVKDLKSLDKGLGAAIVTLTRQIELARTTLEESRNKEKVGRKELQSLITKAQDSADALVRVTHSARDAERNLRFQIAQAGERMRHAATPEPEAPATAPAAARPAVQPAAPETPAPAAERGSAQAMAPQPADDTADTPAAAPEPEAPQPQETVAAVEEAPAAPAKPRRGAALLRLRPQKPRETTEVDLPKPRPLPPLGNPLRNRAALQPVNSEEDLLEALSSLAAGGGNR